MRKNSGYALFLVFVLTLISSCSFYQRKNLEVQEHINNGNVEKAYKVISHKENKWDKGNNKLLYYLNRGTLAWMLNKTEESTKYFLKADNYIDNFQRSYGKEALALISNQKATPYGGEEHEKMIFHYYLALNYLEMGKYESALVQCRRMDLQARRLDQKFKNEKDGGKANKYQRDAFIHNLMGIVYDAAGEYNNAYVAYKNAVDIYENDYQENFGIGVPDQLKKDLIRTSYLSQLDDEGRRFEEKFGMKYQRRSNEEGELVFFWNNGLGPVKGERSINFTIVRGLGGYVTLINEPFGYAFPIYVGPENTHDTSAFAQLEYIRMAYPKYIERTPVFQDAQLEVDGLNYSFELIQDVNKVANKSLNDKMDKIILKMVTRLVMKKVTEYSVRSQDETAGALIGITNAITEQADNRNWQTLPHSIYYSRISLKEGEHKAKLKAFTNRNIQGATNSTFDFVFNVRKRRTTFHSFQTLESVFLR